MGLASLILGDANPFAQYVAQNKNTLHGAFAGFGQAPGIGNGFAAAANGAVQGQQADDAYATAQKAEADRQKQLNQTIQFLQQKYPDLAQAVASGLPIGDAWNEAFKRSTPGYGAKGDPGFSLSPGEIRYDANGKQIAAAPPKADASTAPTLTSIYDANGREQKGYMNGGQFVPVGSPKAAIERPEYTNTQALAAGYADRMKQADAVLDNPNLAAVQTDLTQKTLNGVPVIGNMMTSPEFQQADQAQRDFINAILRRESGAAIAQSEFDNARKQYFPQPGDSTEVLLQKKQNRLNAIKGVSRSAGPAYVGEGGDNAPDDLSSLSDEELLKQLGN